MKTLTWAQRELEAIEKMNRDNMCRERAFERLEKKMEKINPVCRYGKWRKAYNMMLSLIEEMERTNREVMRRCARLRSLL